MHTGTRVRAVRLGALGVQHPDPGARVLGPLADDHRAVLELDRDAVVRGRCRQSAGTLRAVGDVCAVDHRDRAGAVVEESGPPVVGYHVSGLLGGEGGAGQLGVGRVVVGVVPVGLGPHPGVEDREAALRRDEHVPSVAGLVHAGEPLEREVRQGLQRARVEHLQAPVVGEDESRLQGVRLAGVGGGLGLGRGGSAGGCRCARGEQGQGQGDGARRAQ